MGLPWRGPEPCPSLLRPRGGPVRALPPSSCPSHRGHAQVGPETSHFTPLHVPFPIATQTLATSDCRTPSHNLQSLSAGLVACRTPGQEEKERTIPFGDALMMPPETLGLIFPGPGPLPLLLVRGSLLGSSPMGTSCGGRGGRRRKARRPSLRGMLSPGPAVRLGTSCHSRTRPTLISFG